MIVVSDTGPLNYLAIIGAVDVLAPLYGDVIIPPAVAEELSRPSSPPEAQELITTTPPWLKIEGTPEPDPTLRDLGDGEQQAILIAQSLKSDLLLCDDKDARKVAQGRGLRVIGTLGVLQEAAERGLLNLSDALGKLRRTNFRISKPLIDQILQGGKDA